MKHIFRWVGLVVMFLICTPLSAQRFFNLTFDQVKVDTVMPLFTHTIPLSEHGQDSVYTASIVYPEFVDMTPEDVAHYHAMSSAPLPAMPVVRTAIQWNRKQPTLSIRFCPLVYREGKYRILASFMLRVDAKSVPRATRAARVAGETDKSSRYVSRSVLATGRWAKIRIPATGVYELTTALIRKAGFSDLRKVKVYGYGGNLQDETLKGDELRALDDLKEVPTCTVGGRRLFYGKGPVSWSSPRALQRTRNPYSQYGYYFLTENDDAPLTVDAATFTASFYPSNDDYHTLYEVDGFSWYHGGRNLFDPQAVNVGESKSVHLPNAGNAQKGRLSINVSAGSNAEVEVSCNDSVVGRLNIRLFSYDFGNDRLGIYTIKNPRKDNVVTFKVISGGPVRLDFASMTWDSPVPAPQLTEKFPSPEYVYNITNQNHHGDAQADMVIIIPTSQKLAQQARRLADFHQRHDHLRVNIVPADELYNEFSSGTPDANAYRRYLKMLYDRAKTAQDMPKYLLLFGDGVWDNRLLTDECKHLDADDHLLCYESENSFNEITCYVDDGFFCLLDDGEGARALTHDEQDVAVGRFPVTTPEQARIMVDKTIAYAENKNAGAWQNVMMFMGDDGNYNIHMRDLNDAANDIAGRHPGYEIKKVMWDAFDEETTSVGYRYPQVEQSIKQQQQAGALIMDYVGHGRADQISHEAVLKLYDFTHFTNKNLPLWITASCDIMAFDGVEPTIGEAAVLNPKGGAMAFFGTTRTVYSNYNKLINMAFLRQVTSFKDGRPMPIGEAQRLAKNYMISSGLDLTTNKCQYSLLGDPALALHLPRPQLVIDSINGEALGEQTVVHLLAGSIVRVSGHVEGDEGFTGSLTAVVRDSRQEVVCRANHSAETEEPFVYHDYLNTLFTGADSVRQGKFSFAFPVPMDVNYAAERGIINIYAASQDHHVLVHGVTDRFVIGGESDVRTDSLGPKVYCYLNTPDFQNGGKVNTTPYFVARLHDPDGINVTGNGIGHDLQLVIDGQANQTYTLNEYFKYDFGSYTDGEVQFALPPLEAGRHKLMFRAWDVKNNPSTTSLDFTVVKGLQPTISSIAATENPARNYTTFVITHDLGNGTATGGAGGLLDVNVEVFDFTGTLVWSHEDKGISTAQALSIPWDLCTSDGCRVPTGVYFFRVKMSNDGSVKVSQTKKLIVVNNN